MKGENWSEIQDILQIVAYGLVRIRKTKAELELMPNCMFVHQNVPAVDAEERNRLGQEKQLMLLDKAIKSAANAEGFTEITKFDDVIKYDPGSHSWFFPDLWNCRPPKARISQGYIGKTNELRQYLIQLMKNCPSRLTISSFVHRMSDLWNAMLHNDFVLCFRNTQEIMAGTVLNDRISHEVDSFKNLNKLEQIQICKLICSVTSVEELRSRKERMLRTVFDAVEKNFRNMKATLKDVIEDTDICAASKQKYEVSLSEIKEGEHLRINNEILKDMSFHLKKLEYDNDDKVKDLKARLANLEKCCEEVDKDKLSETATKEFEESWRQLISSKESLVYERKKVVESEIEETICASIKKLDRKDKLHLQTIVWSELFKTPFFVEMPQVTENSIVHYKEACSEWVMDVMGSKSIAKTANSSFHVALKKWELQFQNQRDQEFNAFHLEEILLEVGKLLGISMKEECEVNPATDEICSNTEFNESNLKQIMSGFGQLLRFSRKEHKVRPEFVLLPGYNFTPEYIIRFIQFACRYAYNRSLANSKIFVSMTDPMADIGERYLRSVSHYRQLSAEANIDAVSKQIFDYAKRSFVRDLGILIKTEVCKEENPTFKSKRAFLRTILTDLGQKTHNVAQVNEEKQRIFKEFMLYVELAESDDSATFFLDAILKVLKEMLTKECENEPETDFHKIVENNVGRIIEKAKNALRQAETKCKGSGREYVPIFKQHMNLTSEIDFRINTLSGFTETVVNEMNNLYADFLSKANSSFETLVCEESRAAIRTVFEKIMGCREKCPFCSAPCSQSIDQHAGDHRANHHYRMGIRGTVDIPGVFTNTQETYDATEEKQRKPRKLALSTCQAMVGTRIDIQTRVTVNKAIKWYQSDYHSFKKYKEISEYKDWDIPYCRDHNASLYWKWFMAQFGQELAGHYNALCPVIPEAWQTVTWEEAKKSLVEPEFDFEFAFEIV